MALTVRNLRTDRHPRNQSIGNCFLLTRRREPGWGLAPFIKLSPLRKPRCEVIFTLRGRGVANIFDRVFNHA